MKLIVISGAEATCKSDISRRLMRKTRCKLLSKDVIKEQMFDEHERSTWHYGWYESRAKEALFEELTQRIYDGVDTIVESNFIKDDKQRLAELVRGDVDIREIHCEAKGLIGFRRAVRRNESGRRHPGHHDRRWYPKVFVQSLMKMAGMTIGAHKPVGIGSTLIVVDTSNYPDVDFEHIVAFAKD